MSALPYAEPSSVGSASPIHSNQNSHGYEVRQDRSASHTSLRSITSKLLLMQEASPWAVSKLRRCLDCTVAFLALIILSPVFLLVGLLVRVTSPGPVLFRQKRMGRHGTEFTLYKFRSMRADAGCRARGLQCAATRG